ncbi:MAG: 30S ribosomal protein S12 methylthiotransferase RimO [Actinomycetota bacterium]|nr:30S ribosomal protein S12 methylthiotransferase RimO [Actinomycetota bacterium]
MNQKFAILTLGCPKNECDSDHLSGLLLEKGYIPSDAFEDADILILNSCGFIQSAKEESIEAIFELARQKTEGSCSVLVLTGCLSQRYGQELADEIPEIDIILGTHNVLDLPNKLFDFTDGDRVIEPTSLPKKPPTPSVRKRPDLPYAYLKIADGCDTGCSYCAIPSIKGPYKSIPIENLEAEAEFLLDSGVKELILVAQDLALYGTDLYGSPTLPELLMRLAEIKGDFRIRLLYLQPFNLTGEILHAMAASDKICPYIDLPFQHANERILKIMGRGGSFKTNMGIIKRVRGALPDVSIRSSFITGFPSETKKDFEEMVRFLKEAEFDHAGFFKYSPEEGTKASTLLPKVSERVKEERYHQLVTLQDEISFRKNDAFIGKRIEVLTGADYLEGGIWGTSRHQAPEVDGMVKITSRKGEIAPGQFAWAKITGALAHDLIAERSR